MPGKIKLPSADTLAARLAFSEKQLDAWRENAARERQRCYALEEQVRVREAALVHLSLRLRQHGDPAEPGATVAAVAPDRGRP